MSETDAQRHEAPSFVAPPQAATRSAERANGDFRSGALAPQEVASSKPAPAGGAARREAKPDGFIETADPETGELDFMAVWLPPGETPDSLGLTTFVAADEFENAGDFDAAPQPDEDD